MTSQARLDEASTLAMLLDAPSVGPHRANTLLGKHGSVGAAIEELRRSTTSEAILDFFASADESIYRASIERTWELGGQVLLWSDEDYPSNLDEWAARPPLIYAKGDLSHLTVRSLALVGRVDPDETGTRAARAFAQACVDAGITVVSGLARGIDAASHRGALDAAGWTYAVLAHGLDFAYPKENAGLYAEIVERGALITQFRTGVGPQRWTFPMRNELMCTLALGTVIVQGAHNCGSNIQADFSFKHDRPVFVLSKNLKDMPSWATRHVEKGATVVRYFEDVLEVVDGQRPSHATQQDLFADAEDGRPEVGEVRTAIFDLDGVIIDTREATAMALRDVALANGVAVATLESAYAVVTKSPPKALAALGVRDSMGAYKRDFNRTFASHLVDVVVNDEMTGAIERLHKDGYALGVVTSQPRSRARNMIPAALRSYFSHVLTWNDVGGDKASGIERIVREVGGSFSTSVYVGDTPSDLVAARKAGVRSIAVVWGFTSEGDLATRSPDRMVADPGELLEAVGELTGAALDDRE